MSVVVPSVLTEPVLVLNKHWMGVNTTTVKQAFCDICAGAGSFVDTDDFSMHSIDSWIDLGIRGQDLTINSAYLKIRVPEIIVLKSGHAPTKKVMPFSKKNLLRRDRQTCQYCGCRPGPHLLTMDHVHPRSQGGKSSWLNCVMSCKSCNTVKANRTPEQAGMPLRPRPEMQMQHPHERHKWSLPYEPSWSPVFKVHAGSYKASWHSFLEKMANKTEQVRRTGS